jgi:DNA-binding NarL/FixJ family response regulator
MLRTTPGERRILQLLAEGTRRSELAASLQLPELELECRLATLFGRMGVRTDAEAAAEYVRRGLLWARR